MSAGSRRNETFLESLHSGMSGPRGSAGAAGGMQHLTNLLVNISGVKSLDGGPILDSGRLGGSKDSLPTQRSGSLNESPERDESKVVVLRQNRERKQDKRNSAGIIPLTDTANLKLPNRQRRASFSLLFPSSRLLEADASQEKLDRFNEVLSTLSSGLTSVSTENDKRNTLDSCGNDEPIEMESSWQEVVKKHEMLSKKEHAQQSAIWELLTTEVNYMRILKSVINVYARTMAYLQKRDEHFLSDISYERLFSNIEEIYKANRVLWQESMSLPLTFSRETGNTLNPLLLKDAFKQMASLFEPYIIFCMSTDACHRYLQQQKENNQMFSAFLQWADNQILNELGVREGLKAHLTKPMQRLTRYKVILMRIKEETQDAVLREELQEMADMVDDYVTRVNNEIANKQKRDKLQEIQKKIGHYDCIEPPGEEYNQFISKYSSFKVKTPMSHNNELRALVLEGYLKMKEGQARWTEVYCFLFTDMFLITKATKRSHPDRLKILKPPMALDKIHPHLLNGPNASIAIAHLSDFGCLSNIYAFTDDSQKLDNWFSKITETRRSYLIALGLEEEKEEPSGSVSPNPGQATRYGRTISVQSPLSIEKEARRRSSTFGGLSPGSAPALSSFPDDQRPGQTANLAPFNPHHISRSPLRRGHREASPLAREGRDVVSGSMPSVVGTESRRSKPLAGPVFGLSSSEDAGSSVSAKKRLSLGAGGQTPTQTPTTVPAVSIAAHEMHTTSLESFPSSSGVSSVDSAHAHSGSELSACSLALNVAVPPAAGTTEAGAQSPSVGRACANVSTTSTLNGEKMATHFSQDSVSSLSNGSASDEEEEAELRRPAARPTLGNTFIRVVDKRFSRSLNDLSLQSLTVCESSSLLPPSPLATNSTTSPSGSTSQRRRLAPPPPSSAPPQKEEPAQSPSTPPVVAPDGRRLSGLSQEKMRLYLIEGPESEATSV